MILLIPLFNVLMIAINLYMWSVIIMIALSWLLAFGIVNQNNALVHGLNDFLTRITEPFLSKIRKLLPSISGFDLAPMVLILFLIFVNGVVGQIFIRYIVPGGMLN